MKFSANDLAQHALTAATFEGMSGGLTKSVEALDAALAYDRDLKNTGRFDEAERLTMLLDRLAQIRQSHHTQCANYQRMSLTEVEL